VRILNRRLDGLAGRMPGVYVVRYKSTKAL
jgi:hypothetical protein